MRCAGFERVIERPAKSIALIDLLALLALLDELVTL